MSLQSFLEARLPVNCASLVRDVIERAVSHNAVREEYFMSLTEATLLAVCDDFNARIHEITPALRANVLQCYPDKNAPGKMWLKVTPFDGLAAVIATPFASTVEIPTSLGVKGEEDGEHSGLSVNYYQCAIASPTTPGRNPYTAECNDIIEALDMTSAEANIFKEVWRTASARTLGKKKQGHDAIYGAEKILFFAGRNLHLKKSGKR